MTTRPTSYIALRTSSGGYLDTATGHILDRADEASWFTSMAEARSAASRATIPTTPVHIHADLGIETEAEA
jgi:hypothetical protein